MDKKNFNKMMITFGKVYERGLAADVLEIYFNIFKEIPNNQVDYITQECLKRCHYFPRPADIFDHYDDSFSERKEITKASREEWEKGRRGAKKSREDFEKILKGKPINEEKKKEEDKK